jgi:excisionase family DNA binding protein
VIIKADDLRQLLREIRDEEKGSKRGDVINELIHPPVNTKQLCEFLGVTEPTIIRWRKKGKIPFLQIGSSIRFNLPAVIAALEVKKKVQRSTS